MASILDRLLQALPDPISLSQLPQPVLVLDYDGDACWFEIAEDRMYVAPLGGAAHDQVIELRDYKLPELIAFLNTIPGLTAAPLEEFTFLRQLAGLPEDHFGGWCFAETRQDIKLKPTLQLAASVLYQILAPLASGLRDIRDRVESILINSQIDRASGLWLSDWGDLYGVDRQRVTGSSQETDAEYRRRLILELIAPRVNNNAMRSILRERWGVRDVVIEDDETPETEDDELARANGLPWNRMSPFHFWAALELTEFGGFTDSFAGLRPLVQRIKPWGTSWDPLLRGMNPEHVPVTEDTPPSDTYLNVEGPIPEISEQLADFIADIFNESPRCHEEWLLLARPIAAKFGSHKFGSSYFATLEGANTDENPLNDGNASRTMIGPDQLPPDQVPVSLLLGPGRCMESWVSSIIDSWYDVATWLAEDEHVAAQDDSSRNDVFGSEEQAHHTADTWMPDDHRLGVSERPMARWHPFWLDRWGSHLDSHFAKLEARRPEVEAARLFLPFPPRTAAPEGLLAGVSDFSQDFVDGVAVRTIRVGEPG